MKDIILLVAFILGVFVATLRTLGGGIFGGFSGYGGNGDYDRYLASGGYRGNGGYSVYGSLDGYGGYGGYGLGFHGGYGGYRLGFGGGL
ncbi:hypothetical protein ACJMK2_005799 [Sinanodonta woodiana]|uniref:Uncharacterized protein n=2 Tax=Sinanodonta woodiana TaxID=1069815 RepID=A0ABD3VSU7_SINWO